ncbi:hypothetical protein AAF712_014217 [Marasmius tenuissimus]|uniref:Uncharacterized protein n=1 Tax=Marasmius tenuissimus TaxID=585030 RepID=A0ABR2ZDU5_9AGAR
MQTGHAPVKRSPSTTPPPHRPSAARPHLSTEDVYTDNTPRAMHSTLAVQPMVPYHHYTPREATFDESSRNASYPALNFEAFTSAYNPTQYTSSSGWSTPAAEYVPPASAPQISVPHSIGQDVPYTSTPSYPSPGWAQVSQHTEAGASTSDLATASYAPYVPDHSTMYGEPFSHPNYGHAYPITSHRQISPVASAEFVPSPYTGGSVHHTPPLTPGEVERYTPSPHEGGESSSASQQPQASNKYYTHKEQLHFFKEATKLPFSTVPLSPFVPQMMYKPHTNSDRRRYVEEVELDPPIYFWVNNPTECGISLADALHSRVRRLVGREETVFEGRGPSVSIRLEWPGYRQWSRQIPTKDFRTPPGPITKAKLAKNVAKCVQRFILERQSQRLEDESDGRWRVGTSPGTIRLEDLVLVSMHHVSMGSWQPQLRICRPSQASHHIATPHYS